MSGVAVIPSARRLMKSLRDMGYDFAQAVADVVDNSIAAGASEVRIDIEFAGDDSWVRISDNGHGMTADALKEAMRYGAEREYEDDDLGKFGLGLKTASISQCQRLSVASRPRGRGKNVAAFAWDLSHIEKANRWEILPVRSDSGGPTFRRLLDDEHGTIVLWQRLDRLLGYKKPYGEVARTRLAQMCREVEQHIAAVHQKFIEARGAKKVRITINGNEVRPWDPFCRSEPRTVAWEPFHIEVDEEGTRGSVRVESFILPHQSDFSSTGAFKNAAGVGGWNQQQGFYVYRAGRLVQSGGWSRLRAVDEHTKLARVSLSFAPRLDEAFKVNVAKMRVLLPASIRDALETHVKQLTAAARRAYDRKERTAPPVPSQPTKRPAGRPTAGGVGNAGGSTPRTYTLPEWGRLATKVAKPSERRVIRAVVDRLSTEGH